MKHNGFTAVEILISIAIVAIIGTIAIQPFVNSRKPKEIQTTADGIVQTLERAKADALAGKNDTSYGVYFSSTTYAYFVGSSYATTSPSNVFSDVFGDLRLSTTLSGSRVVFSHLTGSPSNTGTVTVSDYTGSTTSKIISIGSAGDINVVQ